MDPTGIMNPVSGRPSLRLRWIRPGDSGCRIPATRPRITPYSPVTVNPSA
jgi:hypothetical protein